MAKTLSSPTVWLGIGSALSAGAAEPGVMGLAGSAAVPGAALETDARTSSWTLSFSGSR